MTNVSYNYAQNQFYGLSNFEPFSDPSSRGNSDNPPFIWPPDSLRNAATGQSTKIQRGYLRLLSELFYGERGDTTSKRRLHFQFNPDVITRSVAARNDIQLWFNLDPAQMAQPMPGDANFAFELLFNREAEVYSAYNSNDPTRARPTRGIADEALSVDSSSYVYGYNVADIGVLADLLVFDELIGQGVNKELIDAMARRAEAGSAYTLAQSSSEDTADEEDQEPETTAFNAADTKSALESNWGNSAFLISQPIRVVFSSLFMVEGFVNSTTVVFNKFTPTMVPVQATVGVQMQAMYMGFGKKDTFFTTSFSKREDEIEQYNTKIDAETKSLSSLGANLFKKVTTPGELNREDFVSVREFLLNKGTDGNTNRDPVITKHLRVRASDALRDQLSQQKTIKEIMPSGFFVVTYLEKGAGAPANTFNVGESWQIPINFESPLNLKDLDNTQDNPDDRMTMKIQYDEDFFGFGVSTPLDTTSGSKWRVQMSIRFDITTNAGGSAVARQFIVYDSGPVSFTQALVFGDNATFDVTSDPSRRAGGN